MNVPYTRIDAVYYTLYSYAAYIYIYIYPPFLHSFALLDFNVEGKRFRGKNEWTTRGERFYQIIRNVIIVGFVRAVDETVFFFSSLRSEKRAAKHFRTKKVINKSLYRGCDARFWRAKERKKEESCCEIDPSFRRTLWTYTRVIMEIASLCSPYITRLCTVVDSP